MKHFFLTDYGPACERIARALAVAIVATYAATYAAGYAIGCAVHRLNDQLAAAVICHAVLPLDLSLSKLKS